MNETLKTLAKIPPIERNDVLTDAMSSALRQMPQDQQDEVLVAAMTLRKKLIDKRGQRLNMGINSCLELLFRIAMIMDGKKK